jgi:hypothetical protein
LQADGKILAGGNFQSIGGQSRNRIARLDPLTGQADSFDPNASNVVLTIAIQADGKILVGGIFWGFNSIGQQARYYIARLDPVTGLAVPLTRCRTILSFPSSSRRTAGFWWAAVS